MHKSDKAYTYVEVSSRAICNRYFLTVFGHTLELVFNVLVNSNLRPWDLNIEWKMLQIDADMPHSSWIIRLSVIQMCADSGNDVELNFIG